MFVQFFANVPVGRMQDFHDFGFNRVGGAVKLRKLRGLYGITILIIADNKEPLVYIFSKKNLPNNILYY